jgi:hypothetical protein
MYKTKNPVFSRHNWGSLLRQGFLSLKQNFFYQNPRFDTATNINQKQKRNTSAQKKINCATFVLSFVLYNYLIFIHLRRIAQKYMKKLVCLCHVSKKKIIGGGYIKKRKIEKTIKGIGINSVFHVFLNVTI